MGEQKFIFWVAVIGWILAVFVHLLAFFDIDVEGKAPYIWWLHIGIFLVWIPTVFMLKNRLKYNDSEASRMPKGMKVLRGFKFITERTPNWIAMIAGVGLVYAFANFIWFFFTQNGTPAVRDGQYYLHSHGQWMRNITEKEYYHYKAGIVRGFSGHWIAFYGMAVALLYPFKKRASSSARSIS